MSFLTKLFSWSLALFFKMSPSFLKRIYAHFLAWLWWDLLRLRRFTVLKNITRVFPEKTHAERLSLAKKSMQNMCYNFIEFGLLPFLNKSNFEQNTVFHGLENWRSAQSQGKGALFLTLHLGNGDQAIALLTLKGVPIHVISKKFSNRFAHEFWFGVREKLGTHFIDPHGVKSSFEILKACKKNEAVIFVLDQFMGPPYGIETSFFGHKTGTAYGLALFALKTGAPVLPIYTFRDKEYKTHIVIEKPVEIRDLDPNSDRDLQIKAITEQYNRVIERLIRENSEHWMWVHRRWKVWRVT